MLNGRELSAIVAMVENELQVRISEYARALIVLSLAASEGEARPRGDVAGEVTGAVVAKELYALATEKKNRQAPAVSGGFGQTVYIGYFDVLHWLVESVTLKGFLPVPKDD